MIIGSICLPFVLVFFMHSVYRLDVELMTDGLCAAIVSRRDAVEEQNAVQKYEEAKAAAERCMESAVSKRQRAQLLLENADLAAYKAVVALRIAEAIQASELPEAAAATAAAACFLE